MNPSFRFVAAVFLALLTVSADAAGSVVDQLYSQRTYELADAYWAAGQRFADLGQADRAAEFKAKALRLFPGYVPGQAPAATPPTAVPPPPELPSVTQVREQNLQGQKIARLQFQKLLRGYLTASASTVVSVLGDRLAVQGQDWTLSRDEVAEYLNTHPTEAAAPDDLFNLDSLDVSDGPGALILVKVAPNPDAKVEGVPFWTGPQTYTFDRVGDTWKLVAISAP